MGNPIRNEPKIKVLEMLRGIAAIMVVMFHAHTYLTPSDGNTLSFWLTSFGASGVDLFFYISGFVMVLTTRRPSNRKVADFAIKRVARIMPPYIVLTTIFVCVVKLTFYITGFFDPNYPFACQQILRSLLFIPLHTKTMSDAPMWGGASLHVGWTLNYEMYFYTIFAASLCFGSLRWIALFSWIGFTLIALPVLAGHGWFFDAYGFYGWKISYLNLITSPLIWEFVGGMLTCFVYLSPLRFPGLQSAWLTSVVIVSLATWLLFDGFNPGFGMPRWGWIYALLFLVLVMADKTLHFRVHPVLVWLGKVSFSLYLVHPIVVESVGIVLLRFNAIRPLLVGLPYILFLTSLSLGAAAVSHWWLETVLSNWTKRKLMLLFYSNSYPAAVK